MSSLQPRRGERKKGTRHSEEQIIAILKQGEAGLTTAELCRQHGITEQTYYRWKAKYGGMDSGDAKKLRQLEDENLRRRLKELAAKRTRFGYRRLTAMLVRAGMPANHKRVYRLYREEGLAMRIRQRRRMCWNGVGTNPAPQSTSRAKAPSTVVVNLPANGCSTRSAHTLSFVFAPCAVFVWRN